MLFGPRIRWLLAHQPAVTMRQVRQIASHVRSSAAAADGADAGTAEEILFSVVGSFASIVLNRPEKLNSITAGMVDCLAKAYADIKAKGGKVIVMKGEGRAFCSGGDVASVRASALSTPPGRLQHDFFYDGGGWQLPLSFRLLPLRCHASAATAPSHLPRPVRT